MLYTDYYALARPSWSIPVNSGIRSPKQRSTTRKSLMADLSSRSPSSASATFSSTTSPTTLATVSPELRVLLGVMTSPLNPRLRTQWREWRGLFNKTNHGFTAKFVLGREFYVHGGGGRRRLRPPPEILKGEVAQAGDLLFVDGREKLPHVGKVTEKSAAWWLGAVHEHPDYDFYCKADDDTLVHVDRLHAVLDAIRRARGAESATYIGHVKWRGWDVGHRFQACGGGWGPAHKTGEDIARGGMLPGGQRYPPCPHAAGPYPYMSGGMVCMSRRMATLLARDPAFNDFVAAAKRRNTAGQMCRAPHLCAAQSVQRHMWHHEDAGVGFNVFRAVVAANATAAIVPIPGHYNDAGTIERTASAQDRYWSARAVFVHGIKGPSQYAAARTKWRLDRPTPYLGLRCYPCDRPGTNLHNGDWRWARLPCPAAIAGGACATDGSACPEQERMCAVEPARHFVCCGWPWLVPELRDLIIDVLRRVRTKSSDSSNSPQALSRAVDTQSTPPHCAGLLPRELLSPRAPASTSPSPCPLVSSALCALLPPRP